MSDSFSQLIDSPLVQFIQMVPSVLNTDSSSSDSLPQNRSFQPIAQVYQTQSTRGRPRSQSKPIINKNLSNISGNPIALRVLQTFTHAGTVKNGVSYGNFYQHDKINTETQNTLAQLKDALSQINNNHGFMFLRHGERDYKVQNNQIIDNTSYKELAPDPEHYQLNNALNLVCRQLDDETVEILQIFYNNYIQDCSPSEMVEILSKNKYIQDWQKIKKIQKPLCILRAQYDIISKQKSISSTNKAKSKHLKMLKKQQQILLKEFVSTPLEFLVEKLYDDLKDHDTLLIASDPNLIKCSDDN